MEPVKSGWQELKTTSGPKCPKLFYNFTADEDGYTTQFTDLIGFWTAASPVTDVVDYAKITKTSIDPSDSKSQLQVLLQKLSQSLEKGANTLRLEDGETEAILLQTVLPLPRPLQPLKWEFYLEPRGTEDLAENVLRPCLLEASESKKKIDSLHEVIKTKDHVISKLIDKIEGSTIDLSTVFPGITGARSRKGQTTLKDAQKHVPGLKPFSRTEWQKHFHLDSPYAGFETVGLSKLVAGCEKCPKHKSHQHEQWLKKLPKATSSASQAAKLEMENTSSIQDDTDSDSDQFETQRKKILTPEKVSLKDNHTRIPSPEKPSRRAKTSSPIRSSSPLLPPPPLSISQSQNPAHSSSATLTSDPSDLDTTITTTSKPRLGKLGNKPKTPMKPKPHPFETQTSSSPPPMPRLTSPSPQLTSSPPLLPPFPPLPSATTTTTTRPISSSSIATLSSLNPPATPPKRKLSRLNSVRTNSISESASLTGTPEHKRLRLEKESDKDNESEKPISSTQGTPTRRLGRIGRTASQLSRQQTRSSPMPMPELDENENEDYQAKQTGDKDDAGDDSDASTASTASSVSPLPKSLQEQTNIGRDGSLTKLVDGSMNTDSAPPPPEEAEPELSKEEKAAKRREELKRKIGTNTSAGTGGGGTVGNTGLRKKRKF